MRQVTAAIIEDSGKILIARRSPASKLAGMWEFPGGKVEEGESPELCLVRELREELGIETEVEATPATRGERITAGREATDNGLFGIPDGSISSKDNERVAGTTGRTEPTPGGEEAVRAVACDLTERIRGHGVGLVREAYASPRVDYDENGNISLVLDPDETLRRQHFGECGGRLPTPPYASLRLPTTILSPSNRFFSIDEANSPEYLECR
jgi:8-oxo-dGTP pyrophosphatase MutT (NUDIX family)